MTIEQIETSTSPASAPLVGAGALAESLIAEGVTTIFGVPGDTGVAFYDALYSRTGRLRHVLARDERHAVAMADAYARVTNGVGVAEVSSGGGTTYAVGGLGEAFASGVPVVLITSDIHRSSRGTGALTEIDQVALFSAVTKRTYVVERASDIPRIVRSAIHEAREGRPAPIAIVIPEDVLDEPAGDDIAIPEAVEEPLRLDAALIAEAASLLASASSPAIVAGSGVHSAEAYDALRTLAERAGAGVASTIHGRGVIADGHPLALGVVGNNGGQPGSNAFLRDADVAVLVGTRANATDTDGFLAPDRGTCRVIRIDIDPERAQANYPEALRIVGDARTALEAILAALPAIDEHEALRRAERVASAAADKVDPLRPPGSAEPADGELIPADVLAVVSSILPARTPITADPGTPTPNVANYWPLQEVGRTMIIPRGHGPMGYAIPAAIGVSFARPGIPVVSVTADGSFAMCCGELETAARYDLPILFLQMTNHSFGWIKMLQHLYYDQRYFGVDPGTIDAKLVAEASGIEAHRVASLDELRTLVEGFAKRPRPLYIDITVPHMMDHTPPVPAWHRALAGDSTRPVY